MLSSGTSLSSALGTVQRAEWCALIVALCMSLAAPVAAKDPQPDASQRPPPRPPPPHVEVDPWLLIAPPVQLSMPAELQKARWRLTRLETLDEQRIAGFDDYTDREPDEVIVVSNGKAGHYEQQPGGWKAWVYPSLRFSVYAGVDDMKAFLVQRDVAAADPARRQQKGEPTAVFYAGPHNVVLLAETVGFAPETEPIKAWLRERIASATSSQPTSPPPAASQ